MSIVTVRFRKSSVPSIVFGRNPGNEALTV
jgi:hypothetical protein